MRRQGLVFAGITFLALAWPFGIEFRKAFFPEAMLKRTKAVTEIENECKVRKFSTFIVREKSLFSKGIYDLYEGAQNPTEEELRRINGGRLAVIAPETGGLIYRNYFGFEKSLQCLQRRMASLGYKYEHLTGRDHHWWTAMDKMN